MSHEERKMKSEFLKAKIFNLKRMLYVEQNKGNRTSVVWGSPAVRHTSMSWWWCGPGGASLPGINKSGGCCFSKVVWLGHISDCPAPVKFILYQDMCLPSAWRIWAQKNPTELLVLRLKLLTQQLVFMCDQPIPAVGAWDFKAVLLLGSLCTAEQAFHKAQSRFSDINCRKFH